MLTLRLMCAVLRTDKVSNEDVRRNLKVELVDEESGKKQQFIMSCETCHMQRRTKWKEESLSEVNKKTLLNRAM